MRSTSLTTEAQASMDAWRPLLVPCLNILDHPLCNLWIVFMTTWTIPFVGFWWEARIIQPTDYGSKYWPIWFRYQSDFTDILLSLAYGTFIVLTNIIDVFAGLTYMCGDATGTINLQDVLSFNTPISWANAMRHFAKIWIICSEFVELKMNANFSDMCKNVFVI